MQNPQQSMIPMPFIPKEPLPIYYPHHPPTDNEIRYDETLASIKVYFYSIARPIQSV